MKLTLAQLRDIWAGAGSLSLDAADYARIEASAKTVADALRSGNALYGINTGFGKLASTRISDDNLAALQRNLILSHAVGVGPALNERVTRLALAIKVVTLAQGRSGVRRVVVDGLLKLLTSGALPVIPSQGSVGASGDLAPLAHLACPLLGEGEVRLGGETLAARDGLQRIGLEQIVLGPKEGLALINGTQISTALALDALFRAQDVFNAALVAGAMSVDALKGTDAPFDERIHLARGQKGQIEVAARLRKLIEGSAIRESHRNAVDDPRVQDPYSLRCQPQVMGACLDVLNNAAATLEIEANAVTDNPLVFAEDGVVLSGGNFHAEPVAFAADMISMAVSEIASISERRIALLIDPALSGLPPFLTREGGLNSGFMILHVTAAALVSENKTLAHPASVDSLPTSANQEDHVSMATFAGRKAGDIATNAAHVIAIELLAAAQGVDFQAPLKTSPALQKSYEKVRAVSAFMPTDRSLAGDIGRVRELIEASAFAG
ncbi:histidine ammonia-lyase [Candidatus Viadribacter manganicus]|uniref:Histidine ammonia-lyase n=1 Tax=Candidatus Viadribacter manganicus TaxID=1759059 RepID=A0A1B1AJ91_9PROT|nr:histidine ammonia-lyase [Candidatus Viadribacter manganicus]ANP46615.1 histidine ammonia-lyase [Candidatus Viadribacter manganicus]